MLVVRNLLNVNHHNRFYVLTDIVDIILIKVTNSQYDFKLAVPLSLSDVTATVIVSACRCISFVRVCMTF